MNILREMLVDSKAELNDYDVSLETIEINETMTAINNDFLGLEEFNNIYNGLNDINRYAENNRVTNSAIEILTNKMGEYEVGFEGLKDFLKKMWDSFVAFLKSMMNKIREFISKIFNMNKKNKEKLAEIKKDMKNKTNNEPKRKDGYIEFKFANLIANDQVSENVVPAMINNFNNLIMMNKSIIRDKVLFDIIKSVSDLVKKLSNMESTDEMIKEIEKIENLQYEMGIKMSSSYEGKLYTYNSNEIPKSVKTSLGGEDKSTVILRSPILPGNRALYLKANKEGNLGEYKYFLGEYKEHNEVTVLKVKPFTDNEINELNDVADIILKDVGAGEKLNDEIWSITKDISDKTDKAINSLADNIEDDNKSELSKKIMTLMRYSVSALTKPPIEILKINSISSSDLIGVLKAAVRYNMGLS